MTIHTVNNAGFQDAEIATRFADHIVQISHHSAAFFFGAIFRICGAYFLKVYLARVLGAESLGIYAQAMTIVGFLSVFNGLGLPMAAVRFVGSYSATGRSKELQQFIRSALFWLLCSNLLLVGVMLRGRTWLAGRVYHTPALSGYLGLFALIMFIGNMSAFFNRALQGFREVWRVALVTDFIMLPLTIVLSMILISLGAGLRGYVLAQIASGAMSLLILIMWVSERSPSEPPGSLSSYFPTRQVLASSATFQAVGFLGFLVGQSDRVLIGIFRNANELGVYAVAMGVIGFMPIALQSVNQIFAPIIAGLQGVSDREVLKRLFQAVTRWITAFTMPLSIVVFTSPKLVMRMFGADFEVGWIVLVIGAVGQLVNCGVGSVGFLLMMSGHEQKLFKAQLASTIVSVVLGLSLIPRFGICGGAIASAITNVLINIFNVMNVKNIFGFLPVRTDSLRMILPVCVTILIVVGLGIAVPTNWPLGIRLLLRLVVAYSSFFIVWSRRMDVEDRMICTAVWQRIWQAGLVGSAR